MKKLKLITCLFLLSALVFTACKKNGFSLKDNIFLDGKASLKINYFSALQAKPIYQIKIDGQRVSNGLVYPTPYPGGGLNTGGGSYADYLAVDPGSRKVDVSIANVGTNNDSIMLASATVMLDAGKTYSLYYADTAANTTSVIFEDNLTSPDSGFVKYRLINLMPDMTAGIDLYVGTTSTYTSTTTFVKVAGPVLYKAAGDYFTLPINTGNIFWCIRPAGALASSTPIATYTSASTSINQRVFSVVARGYNSVTTPTTDGRLRNFSFVYNR